MYPAYKGIYENDAAVYVTLQVYTNKLYTIKYIFLLVTLNETELACLLYLAY